MKPENHPLFRRFPITGTEATSAGNLPVPYHIYAGRGLLIGGTVSLDGVTELLDHEAVTPLRTVDGLGLMGIWACEFTTASLGPHNELQFSLYITHESAPTPTPLDNHPLALLEALTYDPTVRLFCHGLWNNTENVVAYNSELLGLPAHLNEGTVVQQDGHVEFSFHGKTNGKKTVDSNKDFLLRGKIHRKKATPMSVGWDFMRRIGLRRMLQLTRQKELAAKVVNPIGTFPHNRDAQAYIATEGAVLQYFDPEQDTLEIDCEPYQSLDFTPLFCEHFDPFRFVYLHPE